MSRSDRDVYSSSALKNGTERDLYSNSAALAGTDAAFEQPPRKRKKRRAWKIVLAAVLILLLAGVGYAGYYAVPVMISLSKIRGGDVDKSDLDAADSPDFSVINVALFGCDTRDGTDVGGRSDTVMVLSVNPRSGKIHVFSIMRDTLVKIPGHGAQKINAAYRFGGAQLAMKTINANFGLDVSRYVSVNFVGLAKIIDALGGLELTLSKAEVANANKHMIDQAEAESKASGVKVEPQYIEKAGTQVLSGMQAVAYARIREVKNPQTGTQGDYGRTDRQREVLRLMFRKARGIPVSRYSEFIDLLQPYVETDLNAVDVAVLGYYLAVKDLEFVQMRVPQADWVISSGFSVPKVGSTVYYNLDYAGRVMRAMIYDDADYQSFKDENGVSKKGWY